MKWKHFPRMSHRHTSHKKIMHENDHIQTRTGKTPGKRHRHNSKHIETSLDIDEGDIEQIGSYIVSLHGPNPRVAHCNTTCTYWRDKTLSTKVEHCLSLHTRRGLGGDSPEDINSFAVLRVSVAQHNLQVVVKNENTVGTTGTAEHVIKFIVTDMTAQVECSRSRLFPLIGVESRCHLSPHQVILSRDSTTHICEGKAHPALSS